MAAFKKAKCEICGNDVSLGGAAHTAHMRMHVRKKEAIEHKQGNKLLFLPAQGGEYLNKEPYAKLGNTPIPGQPKDWWDITEALAELRSVCPADYYITSGEAVKKAEKLVQDAYSLSVKARAFRDRLKKTRGIRTYLETAREGGRLLVKAKDPKNKGIPDEPEPEA